VHTMNIIGEVEDKTALILDDMVDTAGTLTQAAGALLDRGAKRIMPVALIRFCQDLR